MTEVTWRKSSFSGSQANCVEVADHDDRVLVRDTKNRAGVVLRFSSGAWRRFADQVKRLLAGPIPSLRGHSHVLSAPFGASRAVPRGRRGAGDLY